MGYDDYVTSGMSVIGGVDLGDINLGMNGAMLSEITVSGRAITTMHRLDKQIFDAGQLL